MSKNQKFYTRRVNAIKNELTYFYRLAYQKQFQLNYINEVVSRTKQQHEYPRLRRIDQEYIRGLEFGLIDAYNLKLEKSYIRYLCRDGAFRLQMDLNKCESSTRVRLHSTEGPCVYLFTYPVLPNSISDTINIFYLPEDTRETLEKLNLKLITEVNLRTIGGNPSIMSHYCINAPVGPGVVILDEIIPRKHEETSC